MILNNNGDEFSCAGKRYVVGEKIIVTKECEYEGLIGSVIEIRDGEDKETDNDTPDIYCCFSESVLKVHKEKMKECFSKLWNKPHSFDDINIEQAIMAPDMIISLDEYGKTNATESVYALIEEACIDGDTTTLMDLFADEKDARNCLEIKLKVDMDEGMLHSIQDPEDYEIEETDSSYECYLKGFYTEWHYSVRIIPLSLNLYKEFNDKIGKRYVQQIFADDFEAQVEGWDEFAKFSVEEYEAFISNPEIPKRIAEELKNDESFMSEYIGAVCEIAHKIVEEAVKKRMEENK